MEMFVGGVDLQAEMGDEKISFVGQVEENDTVWSDVGCIVIMSSLLIKLLWWEAILKWFFFVGVNVYWSVGRHFVKIIVDVINNAWSDVL